MKKKNLKKNIYKKEGFWIGFLDGALSTFFSFVIMFWIIKISGWYNIYFLLIGMLVFIYLLTDKISELRRKIINVN